MRVLSQSKKALGAALSFLTAALLSGVALAEEAKETVYGQPYEKQMELQAGVTQVAHDILRFDTFLVWLSFIIAGFVLVLLAWTCFRFSAKRNPTPSKTSHNTLLEVLWTGIPVLILIGITIPSFRLLWLQDQIPPGDVVIKATGNQWYWSYTYPDEGGLEFDAFLVPEEDLAEGQVRLLSTDEPVVVPVNKVVRVMVTAGDVIHAWTIPAFGMKIDAVPGRINETWFKAEREGVYYGQCSELCGVDHAFMPIEVHVVSEAAYEAWLTKMASADDKSATRLAAADAQ